MLGNYPVKISSQFLIPEAMFLLSGCYAKCHKRPFKGLKVLFTSQREVPSLWPQEFGGKRSVVNCQGSISVGMVRCCHVVAKLGQASGRALRGPWGRGGS